LISEEIIDIKLVKRIDTSRKSCYYKITLYDECLNSKVINRGIVGSLLKDASDYNNKIEYVTIVGTGFLRNFVKEYGVHINKTKKTEMIYLSNLNRLSKIFKSCNDQSLFIVPKDEIDNLEKIWES